MENLESFSPQGNIKSRKIVKFFYDMDALHKFRRHRSAAGLAGRIKLRAGGARLASFFVLLRHLRPEAMLSARLSARSRVLSARLSARSRVRMGFRPRQLEIPSKIMPELSMGGELCELFSPGK